MKKVIICVLVVVTVLFLGWQQKPKPLHVTLEQGEWSWILQVIDDSPTPGNERKSMYEKVLKQLQAQLDTTKQKK